MNNHAVYKSTQASNKDQNIIICVGGGSVTMSHKNFIEINASVIIIAARTHDC